MFLEAAKALVAKAETQKDALVKAGMQETLLAGLRQAVAEFETASAQVLDGRRGHIAARAELTSLGVEIREQIRALDKLVRFEFSKEPEKLATWSSISSIGGSKGKVAAPPANGGVVPPTPGSVAPAA